MNIHFCFSSFYFSPFFFFFSLLCTTKVQFLILGLAQDCWQDTNLHKCSLQVEGFWFWQSNKPDHSQCLEFWSLSQSRSATPQLPGGSGVQELSSSDHLVEFSAWVLVCKIANVHLFGNPFLSYVHVCAELPSNSKFLRRRRIKNRAGLSFQPGFSKKYSFLCLQDQILIMEMPEDYLPIPGRNPQTL